MLLTSQEVALCEEGTANAIHVCRTCTKKNLNIFMPFNKTPRHFQKLKTEVCYRFMHHHMQYHCIGDGD